MKWGRKWGNFWGEDKVEPLTFRDLANRPPEAILAWSQVREGAIYHVYIDGKLATTTSGTSVLLQFRSTGRHWFEVFIAGAANTYETLNQFLAAVPGTRVKLSWLASMEASNYKIYWDEGLGGAMIYLASTASIETQWISQELSNGTYKFRVNPVDMAGNETTSSTIITVTVAKYPNAPSNLEIVSYIEKIASFSFTESAIPPIITGYKVFHNNGNGNIDYQIIRKTIPYGNSAFTLSGIGSGNWKVALRAYNATYTEDNIDVVAEFNIAGSPPELLTDPPNVPEGLVARPGAGGTAVLSCTYFGLDEKTKATAINFYSNNGLGGEINYSSPAVSATVRNHSRGENIIEAITATTSALVNGRTYIFAAKSANVDGSESAASETATATADAFAPLDITGLTGETVLYEE